jgi:hypothetical protein
MNRQQALCNALAVVRAGSDVDCLKAACKRLTTSSDLVRLSVTPFNEHDQDAISDAIYDFILNVQPTEMRVIRFEVPHPLVGSEIEYFEFAKRFSSDMLFQNYSSTLRALSEREAPERLATFLAGILFRYQSCTTGADDAFPISVLLDYANASACLFPEHTRLTEVEHVMYVTLLAMCALEQIS